MMATQMERENERNDVIREIVASIMEEEKKISPFPPKITIADGSKLPFSDFVVSSSPSFPPFETPISKTSETDSNSLFPTVSKIDNNGYPTEEEDEELSWKLNVKRKRTEQDLDEVSASIEMDVVSEFDGFDVESDLSDEESVSSDDTNSSLGESKIFGEQTMQARLIEKERRDLLSSFNYYDDDGIHAITLNKLRPEHEPAVLVPSHFIQYLKSHQIEGLHFLWNNVMGSLDDSKKINLAARGCVLAHCMGLGKTLTVISFVVTLLTNPVLLNIMDPAPLAISSKRLIYRVLIVVPKNTLQNWVDEFHKWTPEALLNEFQLFLLDSNVSSRRKRLELLKSWHRDGGVIIIGYEMLRILTDNSSADNIEDRQMNIEFKTYLLNPGADLVIADEAHIIKNATSKVNNILNQIKTQRRIALTGSPLQNNLIEYWVMVNWVKPLFLYSLTEFRKIFANPIKAGSKKDSSAFQQLQMKKRTHALHKKLIPVVHRKDKNELRAALLPKREFLLSVKMTPFQRFLYQYYLLTVLPRIFSEKEQNPLFRAYQTLLRIWNHPACLVFHSYSEEGLSNPNDLRVIAQELNKAMMYYGRKYANSLDVSNAMEKDTLAVEEKMLGNRLHIGQDLEALEDPDFDEEEEIMYNGQKKRKVDGVTSDLSQKRRRINEKDYLLEDLTAPSNIASDWWKFENSSLGRDDIPLSPAELLGLSNKMVTLFALISLSIKNSDKMLVFSQSLYTLNVIECFLGMKNWGRLTGVVDGDVVNGCRLGEWKLNEDYLRIDGSISNRQKIIKDFNGRDQFKLMLISTKAGNMGINLQSANRVVIFDSSWNPVHDLQAIFRTYRFGQEKNVFVYRLYASGSMEEKIHKNQVVKQSLSERVVDARMPENHFNESEITKFLTPVDDTLTSNGLPLQQPFRRGISYSFPILHSGVRDDLLCELVDKRGNELFSAIEDHDSLLVDVQDEHLDYEQQEQALLEIDNISTENDDRKEIDQISESIHSPPPLPFPQPNIPKEPQDPANVSEIAHGSLFNFLSQLWNRFT